MTTKRMRWFVSIFAIAIAATLLLSRLSSAYSEPVEKGEPELGYSEAPFELIENAREATGTTALEAVQAASASTLAITLDRVVVVDDYALMTVEYNYIGVSAVAEKQGRRWQFVCRAGGLMASEELTERCGVPAATAESLYADFLEGLSR